MKLHEVVARSLAELGTDVLFGLMGDANMPYVAHFAAMPDRRYVAAVNEASAVSMAVGFARFRNCVGVATVTHGPGFTNAVTALTEAARSRTPLVVVTGSPVSARRDHPQLFDLEAQAVLAGATYLPCRAPEHCADDLRRAFHHAWSHQVPVVVDVPVDHLTSEVTHVPLKRFEARPPLFVPDTSSDEIDQCLGMLASARRPLVLAGRGAALSGAREALVALADQLGAVLATSLLGKDFFRGEAFDLDMMGPMGTVSANRIAAMSDCVIAFGAELNRHTTSGGSLLEGKPVIQVDVDASRIGAFGHVDVGLVGDARLVAEALVDALRAIDHVPSGTFRTDAVRSEGAEAAFAVRPLPPLEDGKLDMRSVMRRFEETLAPDRQIVTDCGRFVYAPWRYLSVRSPLDISHALNFTSIGLGLSTGLGAAFADPSRVTVVVAGDGGAALSLMELRTAVTYGLPVVVIVLNDGCYGAEYEKLPHYGLDPESSLLDLADFAPVAEALGSRAVTVRGEADLEAALEAVAASRLPLLIDVKCDPSVDVAQEWSG